VGLLTFAAFGLFAGVSASCFGDVHPFASAGADEVRFEFGDHGQDVHGLWTELSAEDGDRRLAVAVDAINAEASRLPGKPDRSI